MTENRSKTTASGRTICSCWSLFRLDLGLLLGRVFKSRVSEDMLADNSFFQGDIHRVPGGHEVIIVTNFHKRLDL